MCACRREGDEDGVGERQGEKVKICIALSCNSEWVNIQSQYLDLDECKGPQVPEALNHPCQTIAGEQNGIARS